MVFESAFINRPVFDPRNLAGAPLLQEPTRGEYLGAHTAKAFDETLTGRVMEEDAILEAEKSEGTYDPDYLPQQEARDMFGTFPDTPGVRHAHAMSEEAWKASPFYRKEIAYRPDMTRTRARIMAENFDERRYREALIANGDEVYGLGMKALSFGATLLGSLPDPVNALPLGGGMHAASIAGKTGIKTAVKSGAKAGVVEGAAGAALSDAIVFPDLRARGEDLGFTDFLLDMAFGAALGGGLGALGGGIHGYLGNRRIEAQDRLARQARLRHEELLREADEREKARLAVESEYGSLDNDFLNSGWHAFEETPDDFFLSGFGKEGGPGRPLITRAETFLGLVDDADMDIARRQRWRDWTGEFREQLKGAGFSVQDAEAVSDVLGAHAEVMAPMFGMEPGAWLESRLAGFRDMSPDEFESVRAAFLYDAPGREAMDLRQIESEGRRGNPIADTVYGLLDRAAIREAYGQDTVNAIAARYGKGVFAKTRGAKARARETLSNDSLAHELVRRGLLPEGSSLDDMINYLATGEGVDAGRALYQPEHEDWAYRGSQSEESPDNDVGFTMWAYGDSERVRHYSGDDYTKMWGINLKDAPNISDFYDAISARWDADHEKGTLPSSLEETYGDADEFLKYIDPDNIVDSAGVWDDLDAVDWLGEFFEEIGVDTIRLWDGAISFNPKSKRIVKLGEYSEELPVIQDNETSGQVLYQPAGMKSSLPQRFAELPGVEADSSQWFGEGKAIAADTKNLRKNLKKWAKENFSGKTTVPNADTGWEVRVTPKGIESSLSHGFDEPLARSVPFIPQIVESGIHVASAKKKAGLMSHIFANKIRLDGKDYVVGFVVREDANGNRFYDHELTEIIDPGWLYQDHFQKKENWYTEPANRGDVMNILRDKLGVNDGSGQVLFQTAWHGTPHRFDEFSLDAIGTGEGNQAHGWGLYFAQKRGTSERYKTDLGVNITLDGKPFYDGVKGTLESSTGNKIADDELLASIGNIDEAIAELQNDVDYGVPEAVDALEVLRNIKAGDRLKVEERGQLFEVDIPEDDVLLDEQKPYYDQPEVVRKAIHAIRDEFGEEASLGDILKDWSGKGVYNYLRGKLGTDKAASLWLNEHGVKGITYDGQQDGRCFVVFDDKAIDVLNTYFQADAKPASARGAIVFRPEDGQALIGLFRGKADISTVIHEGAGHFFLENLRAAAQRPNAPAWVRDGWKDVAKAIGADADPGRSIGTEAHEAFANMAVDYFRRGEAPNIALTTTFQRFARWLAHIYRALTRRGELRDVTPEVKRVMDRLLVAEDQLRAREINRRVTDARNDEADLLRAGLAGREKRDIMRAQEKALADMAAGQPVDVGPVLRDSQALRKARALQREFPDSEAGASSGKTALEPDYSIERRDDFPPAPEVKSGEDAEMSDMDADAAVDADVEARMADLEAQGKLDGEDAALLAEAADQAARIEKYEELGQSVLECVMEVAE